MDINLNYSGSQVILSLKGRFTFKDYEQWRKAVSEAVSRDGITSVVVDFSDVEFIDSAAIGMLLVLREEGQEKKVSISIENSQGQVHKILELSKMLELFSKN